MFPKRIKELREEKDLTQKEFGNILNLSQQTIGHYEAGRAKPDIETLQMIANYFNVSTDYLLGRSNYRTQPTVQAAHIEEGGVVTEDVLNELEAIIKRAREEMKKEK